MVEQKDTVWVVDDDRSIRWVLEKAMGRAGIACRLFASAEEAESAFNREIPSVLISDVRMPGESGLDLLSEVKKRYPDLPVIIMTAFSDLETTVSSFQAGAFDYLAKPFDIDKAIDLIRRALEESSAKSHIEAVPEVAREIIGTSPAMQEVFRAIGRISQSSVTVLLTGESGAGKEVVARALHKHSPRFNQPFIALNMAAIPHELMESELFGHEKGAFTGANTVRHGRFEQAEGGTLFLDEIGDMPAELQTRLLRVLSDGYFYRIGGHQAIKANVRIIAATNKNLEEMVRDGGFREDLYHRLNVIRLRLPPLRDRKEDVVPLAHHFLAKSARDLGVDAKQLTPEAEKFLTDFPFPGNVRQLENVCNWLTVMAPTQTIKVSDLPEEIRSGAALKAHHTEGESKPAQEASAPAGSWVEGLHQVVLDKLAAGGENVMKELADEFEKCVFLAALEATHGRKVEAATRLGIGRNTITRKLQEFGLE
jgi:two-component system nitrogen regulation response regulator GlnG